MFLHENNLVRSLVTQKTWQAKGKMGLVLVNDRKKLGMDSADPQNRSEWRGRLRRRHVKQAHLLIEENGALK